MDFKSPFLCTLFVLEGQLVEVYPENSPFSDISLAQESEVYELNHQKIMSQFGRLELSQLPFVQQPSPLNGNADFVQIRGTNAFSRTLLMQNGVPVNFQNGLGGASLLLTPESTSELRVVRGPDAVLFGPNAMGGSINFVTDSKPKDALLAQVGSFQEMAFGAITHRPLGAGYVNVSALHETIKGDYTFHTESGEKERRDNNDTKTTRLHTWGATPLGKGLLEHKLVYANQTGSYPGPVGGNYGDKNYEAYLGSFDYRQAVSAENALLLRATYMGADYGTRGEGADSFSFSRNDRYTGRAQLETSFREDLQTALLIEANQSVYESIDTYTLTQVDIGGVLIYKPLEKLQLTPGVRYLAEYDRALSTIQASWEDDTKLWLSLSEGYRPPSVTDLYLENDFYKGNRDLKPETSRQVEFGVKREFGNRVKGFGWGADTKLSYYHIYYRNLISTIQEGFMFTPINLGEAESFGVEFSQRLRYKITELNFTVSQTENRELSSGNDIPLSPNTTYSFHVNQLWGPLSFNLRSKTWSSYLPRGSTERENGWTTYDFFITTFAFSHGEYLLGVDNIFEEERTMISGYPEPERRYYFRARYFL